MCRVISVTTPASSPSGVGDLVGVGHQRHPLEEVAEARRTVPASTSAGSATPGLRRRTRGRPRRARRGSPPGWRPAGRRRPRARRGSPSGRAPSRGRRRPARPRRPSTAARRPSPRSPDAFSDRDASAGRLLGPAQRLPERDPLALGQRLDARDRAVADAALGGVEDPAQRDVVGRVDQHPQVGQRVADLAPLVEAHPADDLVGQADPDEHLLEHPGLRVGAVEDRHVGRARGLSSVSRSISSETNRPRRARRRRRSRRSARRRRRRTTAASACGPGCGRSPRWRR